MKRGDRVYCGFLGNGTVIKYIDSTFVMVLFDKNPPVEYNMEENPTLMFKKELKIIK